MKQKARLRDVSKTGCSKEQELCHLNQFQEAVVENANVWINVLDKEGNIVIWNNAAEKISGYSREEVVRHGRTWERLLYPDEVYCREALEKEAALRENGDATSEIETTIRCKDGHTKTISWNSQNLKDKEGNLIGSIALVRDITEQKKAEEALRRRAIQVQTIGEVGRKVSSILNLDELLSYVVRAIQESFGYYHVDIFLTDREQGYAVFKTSSDPSVEKQWKQRHQRFKLGEEGMTGWVERNELQGIQHRHA